MIETASRIIARFGQAGQFERIENPPVNPGDPPGTTVYHDATVAVVSYETDHRDGTLILANDLRVLVSVEGLSITPSVSDRIHVGSVRFNIIRVLSVAPDGVARFHDLQVRR